jgi:mRNA interferase MazF
MRRGEIWLVSLDPTTGAEIRKTRPAVIVSDDAIGILPLKVIVPIVNVPGLLWDRLWQEGTCASCMYLIVNRAACL